MVGATSAEGGTPDVRGVSLAGIILEGLGSLADSATSGAAALDSATLAVSDVAGSVVLAPSGAGAAIVLDEAASCVLATSGAGSYSSKSAESKAEDASDGGLTGSMIALPEAENHTAESPASSPSESPYC